MPRSSRTNNDVRVPRYWKRIFVLTEEQSGKSVHQTSTETALLQSSAEIPEQVVEGDPRKQLELSVPRYDPGDWKYEFKMSSFATIILNLLFKEAEQKGKTRNFRMHIEP